MSFTFFISMLSFCFVLSISPGPVNVMIITSSLNNGFKKTFSFISGATIGFTLLLVLISLTYEKFLFSSNKSFLSSLEIIGSLFIIYMAYKIASSKPSKLENKDTKILKFYEGFLLQWLNPKAWLACLAGISMFAVNTNTLILFVFMYFVVCYACLSFWGLLAQKSIRFFNTEVKLKIFNIFMGLVLFLLSFYILLQNIKIL